MKLLNAINPPILRSKLQVSDKIMLHQRLPTMSELVDVASLAGSSLDKQANEL